MSALSDSIEAFIIALLKNKDTAELRRNELAAFFGCAPSQINYVLSTRFSIERGYLIRSKRGGGGYIAVERIPVEVEHLKITISHRIGERLTKPQACSLITNLLENGVIDTREAGIMEATVSTYPMVARETQDFLRAESMKAMLTSLLRRECVRGNQA